MKKQVVPEVKKKAVKTEAGPPFLAMTAAKSSAEPLPPPQKAPVPRKKKQPSAQELERQRQLLEAQVAAQQDPGPVQSSNMLLPSPFLKQAMEGETLPQQQPFSVSMRQSALPPPENKSLPQQQPFPVSMPQSALPPPENKPLPQQQPFPVSMRQSALPPPENKSLPQQQPFPVSQRQSALPPPENKPLPRQQPFPVSQRQSALPPPENKMIPSRLVNQQAVKMSPYTNQTEVRKDMRTEYQISRLAQLTQEREEAEAGGPSKGRADDLFGIVSLRERRTSHANAPTITDIETLKPTSLNIRSLQPYLKPAVGLPLFTGKDIIAQTVTNQKLGSLSFAGLDQLTDLFFKLLVDHHVYLPHLTRFVGSGAVQLTNKAMKWLCQSTDSLKEVKFTGCKGITSYGLAILLHTQEHINDIDLCLSGVTVIPPIWGVKQHINLKLDGCALICPPLQKFVDHYKAGNAQYVVDEKEILTVKQHKVVILRHNECNISLAKFIKGDGRVNNLEPDPWPMTIYADVPCGEELLNIYEINRKQAVMDLIISEGSICLLPFSLEKCDDKNIDAVASALAWSVSKIVSKSERIIIMIVGIRNNRMSLEDATDIMQQIQCGVKDRVWKKADVVDRRYKVMTKRKWLVDNYDMEALLYTSRAAAVWDRIQKVPIFWDTININEKFDPTKTFQDAFTLKRTFVWMTHTAAEMKDVEEKLLEKKEKIQSFSQVSQRAEEAALKHNYQLSGMPQPVIKKIAEELHRRGSVLYFPSVRDGLYVTDLQWFVRILAIIMRPPPPSDSLARQFQFIQKDQPMWTKETLRESMMSITNVGKMTNEQQLEQVVALLLDIGTLIEVSVDQFTKDDPSTVYLVSDLLPTEPCIERTKLWVEEKPEGIVQRDKHYQFSPALPMSLLPIFMERISRIYRFTLLWKHGFLIRRGGIDLLMEQESDEDGEPVLVFSVRTEFHRTESVRCRMQCLWSVMNTVTTIMDCCIKETGAFANVIVPCPTCISDKSNRKIVKDSMVYRYFVHLSKASSDKGMRCNSRKYKCSQLPNYSRNVEQILGPENLYNLLPKHLGRDLAAVSDTIPNFNRCAMCENCVVNGRYCPHNGLPAKTVRYCNCKSDPAEPICPSCGVCNDCYTLLHGMHFALHPVSFGECKWKQYGRKGKKSQEEFLYNPKTSWLNITKFNLYIVENVYFCPERFNMINLLIYKGNQLSIGVIGEDKEPLITYSLNRGCFGHDWTFKDPLAKNDLWRCGLSPEVCMKVRHVTRKDNQPKQQGVSMVAVEFYKTGVKIWTQYIPDKKLRVALQGEGPCNMIAQTPTLWSEQPMDADHSGVISGNMFVELEKENDANKLVLASIVGLPDSGNSYVLETDEGEKTVAKNSPRIHPVGFSFVSGTDRILYLTPKLVKSANMPTPTTNVAKKKKLHDKSEMPHVSCIEALNRIIDDKPYRALPIWFFTEEQRAGWESSYCDLFYCRRWNVSPEALLCAFSRSRPKHEEEVMDSIDALYAGESGTCMLLMPRDIDCRQLCYQTKPLFQLEKNYQVLHLCTSHLGQEKSNMHLMDVKGLNLPKVHRSYVESLISAQVYLGLGNQMDLPGYGKLLRKLEKNSLTDEQVVFYFNRLLQSVTSLLMIYFVDCKIAQKGEHEKANMKLISEFLEHKSKYCDWDDGLLMCPAHAIQKSYDPSRVQSSPKMKPYIRFLKSLEFHPSVEKLPDDFFNDLKGLESFNASGSSILQLPKGLNNCSHLAKLEISGTELATLPDDMSLLADRLLHLDISRTKMTEIPSVVFKLTSLETLIADCLLLETLPESIGSLTRLTHLSLNGSQLTELPKTIVSLERLKRLELAGVPWMSIKAGHYITAESFKEFLQSINLTVKQLLTIVASDQENISNFLAEFDEDSNQTLDQFEVKVLNAKLYSAFKRFGFHKDSNGTVEEAVHDSALFALIFELRNLTYLDLSYQALVHVPETLENLTKLETLHLHHNLSLVSLPGALGSLPLESLSVEECPSLQTPPHEICSKGFAALMAYLRRLVTGSVACKRTKLMMVGLGGAGKTSLVKALLSDEHKSHLASGEAITDGIDIHSWTITRNNDEITYSVWDFAGQTVYYNTHQFFLSNRAVYLLLWNIRLGYEHAGLDFWLSSISVHSPQAPIIIVGTHLDQVSNFAMPQVDLRKRYPQIVGFHTVSSWSGKGVSELQQKLFSVTLQQKYMGEKIPEVWLNFEKAIISHRAKSNVVSYSEVEKIATDCGVFDSTETSQAVRFLHDLGTVQHFDNMFLRDKVVINPQWIVDVMACVVSVKDSPIKDGKFKHADIARVWRDFPQEYHEWLLNLTERFDLTFPLQDEAMNLVPCLLKETEPGITWPDVSKKKGIRETKMEYKFEYLPVGLFNRGQVRLYEYSDSSVIWKRGSVLKKNGHVALITQTRDNKLMVKCQGPRPENILFMIHEVFETLIQESFQGVMYDFKVPCTDCLNMGKDPYMFKGSTIRRATGLKTPFLQCVKNFHIMSLTVLNGICPPDDSQDYDLHLKNTVQSLTDLRMELSADIFISYCNKDIPQEDPNMVNPRDIKNSLEAAGYKCWFEESLGKDILEERILALRDAKFFLCMISDNYIKDADCCNAFKFARTVLRKPLIMVTVGPRGEQNWKQSAIGLLVADEVYINFQRVENNKAKTEELLKVLHCRITESSQKKDNPPCFFSYCWRNSAKAVQLGQKSTPEALGYADPRDLKDYLHAHRINCWLDVERTGSIHGGLFEDIADGLRDSQIMVACVSDEYANSLNCQMEFRFAAKALNLPVVVAIVGTSQQWRATEIGMLSLNYPQVNFQEPSNTANEKLLQLVAAHVKPEAVESAGTRKRRKDRENEDQKKTSYQELYELAQRKFLRQISSYTDIYESHPFPRLVIVDFAEPEEEEKPMESENLELKTPPKLEIKPDEVDGTSKKTRPTMKHRGSSASLVDDLSDLEIDEPRLSSFSSFKSKVKKHKVKERPQLRRQQSSYLMSMNTFLRRSFCFRILCENEEGWHLEGDSIPTSSHFGEPQLVQYSPYLARILTIIKHSSKIQLNCVGGEQGEMFIKWLEENTKTHGADFKNAYQLLRKEAGRADRYQKKAESLARCLTTSGKVFWLCESHRDNPRLSVFTNTTAIPVVPSYMEPVSVGELPSDMLYDLEAFRNKKEHVVISPAIEIQEPTEETSAENEGSKDLSLIPDFFAEFSETKETENVQTNKSESADMSRKQEIVGKSSEKKSGRIEMDSNMGSMPTSSLFSGKEEPKQVAPVQGPSAVEQQNEPRQFNPRRKFKAAGIAAQASVKAAHYQGSKSCVIL